jgi:hypothetical protein
MIALYTLFPVLFAIPHYSHSKGAKIGKGVEKYQMIETMIEAEVLFRIVSVV